jgi:hypothetical protein
MKTRLSILAAFAIVVLLVVARHFHAGAAVPSGQQPLVSLTPDKIGQLRAAFNKASGDVRIVLLLSPT